MGNANGKGPVVFTDAVNLDHFKLLRVVGKGAFGKVRIVERRDSKQSYALKYIRKDDCVKASAVRNLIRERQMLEELEHPMICNLRYAFQDDEYIYMILDLMLGGDLRFHIQRKTFTEPAIRFWHAEIALALVYLHSHGIVHRDIKPDNILLDADGHACLTDFNVAAYVPKEGKLSSRSGTAMYMAPEVFEGRGYGVGVDWWSLGVCLYECVYGKRPFTAKTEEELSHQIRCEDPEFPRTMPEVYDACTSAISALLAKDPTKRLGASSFSTFTSHPFFKDLDFALLEKKDVEPIYQPPREKQNFDGAYDLEELLLEDNPLDSGSRRRTRKKKVREGATEAEVREIEMYEMMEQYFEVFDSSAMEALSRGTTVACAARLDMPAPPSRLGPDYANSSYSSSPGSYSARDRLGESPIPSSLSNSMIAGRGHSGSISSVTQSPKLGFLVRKKAGKASQEALGERYREKGGNGQGQERGVLGREGARVAVKLR